MKKGLDGELEEEHGELEYRPVSLKEILIEMRDISDLMIDLAYSAVLFESEDIAEEVSLLENRMDALLYYARITAMLAARDVEDAERLSSILQVTSAAEDISNAAGEIVNVILQHIELHPLVLEALKTSDEKIARLNILENSKLDGITLGKTRLAKKTGAHVIAIRRGKKWIYRPERVTKIHKGDVLIIVGSQAGIDSLRSLAEVF